MIRDLQERLADEGLGEEEQDTLLQRRGAQPGEVSIARKLHRSIL